MLKNKTDYTPTVMPKTTGLMAAQTGWRWQEVLPPLKQVDRNGLLCRQRGQQGAIQPFSRLLQTLRDRRFAEMVSRHQQPDALPRQLPVDTLELAADARWLNLQHAG